MIVIYARNVKQDTGIDREKWQSGLRKKVSDATVYRHILDISKELTIFPDTITYPVKRNPNAKKSKGWIVMARTLSLDGAGSILLRRLHMMMKNVFQNIG